MRCTRSISAFAFAALTVASACSKSDKPDAGLQNDLSLAGQQQQAHLDSVSALEANNAAAANSNALRTTAPAPVRRTSSTQRRTSSGSSSNGSTSSGTVSSGTTVSSAPAPAPVVVKHTQRDAAIGAAAGAVIGATSSQNKIKGGLIGAAVGGILGGVVGNNVDKTKKPPM